MKELKSDWGLALYKDSKGKLFIKAVGEFGERTTVRLSSKIIRAIIASESKPDRGGSCSQDPSIKGLGSDRQAEQGPRCGLARLEGLEIAPL